MKDLTIENEYGSIFVEVRRTGMLVYFFEAKNVEGIPPNHIAFTEKEMLKLVDWIGKHVSNNMKID